MDNFSTSLTQMGEWPNVYNWKVQESEIRFTTSREWVVSVTLGAFVNGPAICPIRTTPFVIAPTSTDPLLDMSELKSLCSFLSHSVKKGLTGADTHSSHSSTSTSAHDDCGTLAFRHESYAKIW
jgi:hypothetical protein